MPGTHSTEQRCLSRGRSRRGADIRMLGSGRWKTPTKNLSRFRGRVVGGQIHLSFLAIRKASFVEDWMTSLGVLDEDGLQRAPEILRTGPLVVKKAASGSTVIHSGSVVAVVDRLEWLHGIVTTVHRTCTCIPFRPRMGLEPHETLGLSSCLLQVLGWPGPDDFPNNPGPRELICPPRLACTCTRIRSLWQIALDYDMVRRMYQ